MQLCSDCQCISRKLHAGKLKLIFHQAATEGDLSGAHPNNISFKTDLLESQVAHVKAEHLSLTQFIEALIRVANERWAGDEDLVSERVKKFIEDDILPHACSAPMDEFRLSLNNTRVQKLLVTHKPSLLTLYKHFSRTTLIDSDELCMSVGDFVAMCKEGNLLNDSLSRSEAERVIAKVKNIFEHEYDRDSALVIYNEYVEGIAAISVLKNPDPYLPLYIKIENFLSAQLYGPFMKVLRKNMKKRTKAPESGPR